MTTHQFPERPSPDRQKGTVNSIAITTAITVFIIGCSVILGWMLNIPLLKSVLPGLVTMKANTALGFILGGASLWCWLRQRKTRQPSAGGENSSPPFLLYSSIAAFAVLLIGLLTLIQYGFQVDFGIDQLLFKENVDAVATSTPGRMAPNSAFNFLVLGAAQLLLCLPRPKFLASQSIAIGAFLLALLGFLGYLYGNVYFYMLDPSFTAMALHTAVAFILWSSGILFATAEFGAIAPVASTYAGGLMARRLSPFALLMPPFICWFILIGYRGQVYTEEMGISLLGISNVIAFSIAIWWNARFLNNIDILRRQAEEALQKALAEEQEQLQQQESLASDLTRAVTEVTSTMSELAASARSTAEQAAIADREAHEILGLSERGTKSVAETMKGMTALQNKVGAIAELTKQVEQIIANIADSAKAVSDLAAQTNMLALNAALEAVRAGAPGKGFGVVATEIRKLADRSKTSADQINALVADIQGAMNSTAIATDEGLTTVDFGAKTARETTEAFQGVAEAIQQIALFNKEVALNAHQQAAAVRQVVEAMNAIDQRANP